ncbi:MAG: hypothetical protein FGM58_09905 [Acidimicrobiia bacterium]|nr:hypothetical protein [Acidimicrobiia bacterium]
MFEAWKARRAEKKRVRAEQEAAARERKRRKELVARRDEIVRELDFARQRLETARTFSGVTGRDVPDEVGITLKKGERVFCVVTDTVLVEPRKGPGSWKGRSQGVSMPIPGTSLRYRIGASRGEFQAGEEKPAPIDEGTFVVTSQRAVFTGQKYSREWVWSKLLGVTHYDPGWTALAVSNRQKESGIAVDSAKRDAVDFWLDLAVAHANDTVDEVIADCTDDIGQLESALAEIDAPTAPAATALPPAPSAPPTALPPTASPPTV